AASVQFWATPKITAHVPKDNFSPPPEVDSAVIALEMKSDKGNSLTADRYYATVRKLFAQPRKTILNNLRGKGEGAEGVAKALAGLGITSELRPHDLTIEQICLIAEELG